MAGGSWCWFCGLSQCMENLEVFKESTALVHLFVCIKHFAFLSHFELLTSTNTKFSSLNVKV